MTETLILSSLNEIHSSLSQKRPLKKFQEKYWNLFQNIGLPTRKTEAYQYVPLLKLYQKELKTCLPKEISQEMVSEWIYSDSSQSYLVFINGHLSMPLSNLSDIDPKVIFSPLDSELTSFKSYLTNRMSQWLKKEKDPFAALNGALFQSGVLIYVPPQSKTDSPHSNPPSLRRPKLGMFDPT